MIGITAKASSHSVRVDIPGDEEDMRPIGFTMSSADAIELRDELILALGGAVSWGIEYEWGPGPGESDQEECRSEQSARAQVAESPTDTGLRRRLVTAWEECL
jgi:hypothetical protein